jgi:hypothetical protein
MPMKPNRQALIDLVLKQYGPKSIERIESAGALVAKTVATKRMESRPIFVMRGNFGRAQFKQAMTEAQAAGIEDFQKMYVYAEFAPYTGQMIEFMRLNEVAGFVRMLNESGSDSTRAPGSGPVLQEEAIDAEAPCP